VNLLAEEVNNTGPTRASVICRCILVVHTLGGERAICFFPYLPWISDFIHEIKVRSSLHSSNFSGELTLTEVEIVLILPTPRVWWYTNNGAGLRAQSVEQGFHTR